MILKESLLLLLQAMTNFIPIFPLELVVYPGEKVNLHIFEERYIQLVAECHKGDKAFGIPPVLAGKIAETGTLVKVHEIVHRYDDGRMDITTEGLGVYRILEVIDAIPEKLYQGAIVKHLQNNEAARGKQLQQIINSIRELHSLLHINKAFNKPDNELNSYDIAHNAGLSLQEEYELLCLLREDQRLEYLRRHLKKIITAAAGIETLRKKIQMNGHFKELKGFDFGTGKK